MLKLLLIFAPAVVVLQVTCLIFIRLDRRDTLDRAIELTIRFGSLALLVLIVILAAGERVIGHDKIAGILQKFLNWLHN